MKQRLWITLATYIAFFIDKELYKAIEYLKVQVEVLVEQQEKQNKRILLSTRQRMRVAAKAKRLSRKMLEQCTVLFTPDISRINRQSTDDPEAAVAETQKKLADKYAEIFSILLKHQKDIDRVTFWGVYDATSWIGGSPFLFDRDYQPKQAFDAVVNVVQ